jgi:hypothetical protein
MNTAARDRQESIKHALRDHRDILGVNMFAIGHELGDDVALRDTDPPVARKPRGRRRTRKVARVDTSFTRKYERTRRPVPLVEGIYPSDS